MPYKDKAAQRAFQNAWVAKRRAAFLADKCCSVCGSKEKLEAYGVKSGGKKFSWSHKDLLAKFEEAQAIVVCEACGDHARRVERQITSTKHGFSRMKDRTYNTWKAMRERCNNANHEHYKYYGGRGVTYDPRWDDFRNFLSDMGERPADMTLDRVDPEKGYGPDNCRWADWVTQANNRRNSKKKHHFKEEV